MGDHGGEPDADLELALKLHRELNAVPRRQRAPPRAQGAAAALKNLTKKHQQQEESEESSSSESDTERWQGGASGEKRRQGAGGGTPSGELAFSCVLAAACRAAPGGCRGLLAAERAANIQNKRWRAGSSHAGCSPAPACPGLCASCLLPALPLPLSWPAADNDSGSKRKRQRGGGKGGGKGGGGKLHRGGRKPQHVAAAAEARSKAAAAAERDGPRTHVKCFFSGVQHGVWLAVEALASRASLAAAASKAFAEEGVACASETMRAVFVLPDGQCPAFSGASGHKAAGAADGGEQPAGGKAEQEAGGKGEQQQGGGGKGHPDWEAAARSAVRVYVTSGMVGS